MKVVLCAIILVLLSVVLLGVRVLLVKGGRFPSGHAHGEALRRRGVECAHTAADSGNKPIKSESH